MRVNSQLARENQVVGELRSAKGESSAVDSKSGLTGSQSGPGLRRPTPAATAGRKPEARPSPSQPKTGQGLGQGPSIESQREALGSFSIPSVEREAFALDAVSVDSLDDHSIQQLISFFEMLDRWDREATDCGRVRQ